MQPASPVSKPRFTVNGSADTHRTCVVYQLPLARLADTLCLAQRPCCRVYWLPFPAFALLRSNEHIVWNCHTGCRLLVSGR